MHCKVVQANEIAEKYKSILSDKCRTGGVKPKLVAFLSNNDQSAIMYATWTEKSCSESGIEFELRQVQRTTLEEEIVKANGDKTIHGIMVYYPVFGDPQDQYIQSCVSKEKDVEGLCHTYKFSMYHNIRTLDDGKKKCIIPCTPLALVKILEHVCVYNPILPEGNRLHGKIITIVNRSEIVGRPLAALLANDGARVFSVDLNSIVEFHRGKGIALQRHEVVESNLSLDQALSLSDVVITGVPTPHFKMDIEKLKEGVVAINFSSFKNFDRDNIISKASIFVPSVGKVTVSMLIRNLFRLFEYQVENA